MNRAKIIRRKIENCSTVSVPSTSVLSTERFVYLEEKSLTRSHSLPNLLNKKEKRKKEKEKLKEKKKKKKKKKKRKRKRKKKKKRKKKRKRKKKKEKEKRKRKNFIEHPRINVDGEKMAITCAFWSSFYFSIWWDWVGSWIAF